MSQRHERSAEKKTPQKSPGGSGSRSQSKKRNLASPTEGQESKKQNRSNEQRERHTSEPGNDDFDQRIVDVMKGAFKTELRDFMKECVNELVDSILGRLQTRISDLETKNEKLKHENDELKQKIVLLEEKCDQNEQYSRRNCLRIHGVPEAEETENTDEYVLKLSSSLKVPITIADIDRSHRVGRKINSPSVKPRAIIVKFSTYRARRSFYSSRFNLKSCGFENVFVNEDLTKRRNSLLYKARVMVKQRKLNKAWSSDGQILIKTLNDRIAQINRPDDLETYQ